MNCLSSVVFLVAGFVVLPISAGVSAAEQEAESGFVSMFDDKSLEGWSVVPAKAAKAWTVKDGMIVGDGDKGRSYLVFDMREIADFELTLRADATINAHFMAKLSQSGRRV